MKTNRIWMPTVLALAVSLAWADEDEYEGPPIVAKPAVPMLPALGSYSQAG